VLQGQLYRCPYINHEAPELLKVIAFLPRVYPYHESERVSGATLATGAVTDPHVVWYDGLANYISYLWHMCIAGSSLSSAGDNLIRVLLFMQ
jgi:hypothetical protein